MLAAPFPRWQLQLKAAFRRELFVEKMVCYIIIVPYEEIRISATGKPGKCLGPPEKIWEKGPLVATHNGTFWTDKYKPPIQVLYSTLLLPQKSLRGGYLLAMVGQKELLARTATCNSHTYIVIPSQANAMSILSWSSEMEEKSKRGVVKIRINKFTKTRLILLNYCLCRQMY